MLQFWGLQLEPGTPAKVKLDKQLHLSSANLDGAKDGRNYVRVFVTYKKESYLLGTLKKGLIYQIPLNVNFEEGAELEFNIDGSGYVHLTGYVQSEELDISSDASIENKEKKKEEVSDSDVENDDDKTDDDDDTDSERSSDDQDKEKPDEGMKENKVAGKRKSSSANEKNESQVFKRPRMFVLRNATNDNIDDGDSPDVTDRFASFLFSNLLPHIMGHAVAHHLP